MSFDPARPYNDLPALPPSQDVDTKAVLTACIDARAALAELRISGELIPNPAILINTIPILEAQASSEIENIVTTTDRLFRLAATDHPAGTDPATREALRCRTALNRGIASIRSRPLSTATAVEVCRTIKGIDLDVRKVPGTALVNDRTRKVVYTPPQGEQLLRKLLANRERFLHNETGIDPVIRMAVGHYQFEAIHPFIDGNGRTGRVLNLLFLVEQGLLELPVLYLSRAIHARRAEYYRLLLDVTTKRAWGPWILFMLSAVAETHGWTTARIRGIRNSRCTTAERMRRVLPKIYSHELVELIFVQPYCRIGNVVDAGIAKRQSASVYLKALTSLGILCEIEAGREKIYTNPALLTLLSDRGHEKAPPMTGSTVKGRLIGYARCRRGPGNGCPNRRAEGRRLRGDFSRAYLGRKGLAAQIGEGPGAGATRRCAGGGAARPAGALSVASSLGHASLRQEIQSRFNRSHDALEYPFNLKMLEAVANLERTKNVLVPFWQIQQDHRWEDVVRVLNGGAKGAALPPLER